MVLKNNKNFWIDTDWATVTDIIGTLIQTLILIVAVIAIFQTNKSLKQSNKALINNEKALENSYEALNIAKADNETLKKQLLASIKPEFKFEFEDFTYLNNVDENNNIPQNTKEQVQQMSDYKMYIKNVSENIANELIIENFFYLDKEQVNEFENILPTDLFYHRRIDDVSHLGTNETTRITFTRYVKYYSRYASSGKVTGSPLLFLKIAYKNKLDEENTDCFMFRQKTSIQGNMIPEFDEYSEIWIQEKISQDYYETIFDDLTINLEEISNERSK
ncbi:hypothetical protein [Staphylococcus saprophyticus]|uniref:hypothetical protein n=1 Tax=Staphylococcus saprophyticus TaxID=29385 RepID=UPI0022EA7CF2|nr:hypothetical protein [Staphylococcus saprophyticus]